MIRKTYIEFGQAQDTSIDLLLAAFDDARATTLARISNIDTDELHWQYAEGWNSISVLLSHFISCSHYFRIYFLENRAFSTQEAQLYNPAMEMGKRIPEIIGDRKPIAFYLEQLQNSRALMREAILKLNIEDFTKKIDAYDPETGSNLAWVLFHAAEDEIHHRGQISIIRKLYQNKKNLSIRS